MKRNLYILISIIFMLIGLLNMLNIIIANKYNELYLVGSYLLYLIGLIMFNVQLKLQKYE